jgi:hypothetical protein
MITFEQLKDVLLQGEMEILQDDYIDELNRQQFEFNADKLITQFQDAKTLLDLVHIYEGKSGVETYDAFECIVNTLMVTATLD